jgi:hypothetical protein
VVGLAAGRGPWSSKNPLFVRKKVEYSQSPSQSLLVVKLERTVPLDFGGVYYSSSTKCIHSGGWGSTSESV